MAGTVTTISVRHLVLALLLSWPISECSGDESAFFRSPPALDSLQALLRGEGETQILGRADLYKPGTQNLKSELDDDIPPLGEEEPHQDCHLDIQVTERLRGHCSALNLMGKSFPVCKKGDQISVNYNECSHIAA